VLLVLTRVVMTCASVARGRRPQVRSLSEDARVRARARSNVRARRELEVRCRCSRYSTTQHSTQHIDAQAYTHTRRTRNALSCEPTVPESSASRGAASVSRVSPNWSPPVLRCAATSTPLHRHRRSLEPPVLSVRAARRACARRARRAAARGGRDQGGRMLIHGPVDPFSSPQSSRRSISVSVSLARARSTDRPA
jgi:hypothetical protein